MNQMIYVMKIMLTILYIYNAINLPCFMKQICIVFSKYTMYTI